MKQSRFQPWQIFMSAVLFMFLSGQALWAAQPQRVLILPFAIHSEKELTFLKEAIWDMLSSRLYQEGKVSIIDKAASQTFMDASAKTLTEAIAVSAAEKAGADYVLLGSLTVLGETISTDAKFIHAATGSSKVTFARSGQQQGDVIAHIQALAQNINETVFGVQGPVERQPATKATDPAENRMNPEKLWEREAGGAAVPPPSTQAPAAPEIEYEAKNAVRETRLVPVAAGVRNPAPEFYTSSDFKLTIRGIAAGDLEGDGEPEIVFISPKAVHIYRFTGTDLKEIQTIKGKRSDNFISVDVADINQNGKAEIFVTNFLTGDSRLASFVLEYGQGGYHAIIDNQRWYYRVIQDAESGDKLLGQQRTAEDEFFSGPVHRLSGTGGGYVSAGVLSLPENTTLYEPAFRQILNDGRQMTATYASGGRLHILDQTGNDVYMGVDGFGLGAVELLFSHNASPAAKAKDTYYIPQRIYSGDFNNDGAGEIILVKNKDAVGGLLKRTRILKSGQVQVLAWKGGEFRKVFETTETPGYISDYGLIDIDGNGRKELMYSVVKSGNIIPGKEKSCIVLRSMIF